jgi:hypothetical protein
MQVRPAVASLLFLLSTPVMGSGVSNHADAVIVDATIVRCEPASAAALKDLIVSGVNPAAVILEVPSGSVVLARVNRTRFLKWNVATGSVESLSSWIMSRNPIQERFFVPDLVCGPIAQHSRPFFKAAGRDPKCTIEPGAEICHLRQDRVLRVVPEKFCVQPAV